MLEMVLEMDYESLADNDQLQFTIKDPAILGDSDPRKVHISQYISLVEEYVTHAIVSDEPETVQSIMAGGKSSSTILKSKKLKACFYTKNGVEFLELKYDQEKVYLVNHIKRLYDVFACLTASKYVSARIPEGSRLQDVFTSHYSQFFIFEAPQNETYVQFRNDGKTVSYQLTATTKTGNVGI